MPGVRPPPAIFHRACRSVTRDRLAYARRLTRRQSSQSHKPADSPLWSRYTTAIVVLGSGTVWYISNPSEAFADAPPVPVDVQIEVSKSKKGLSKEDNRDLISSQHLKVRRSWENPGVYAWGSNSGRVVAPDTNDNFIKAPRRIPFFDGVLLRGRSMFSILLFVSLSEGPAANSLVRS